MGCPVTLKTLFDMFGQQPIQNFGDIAEEQRAHARAEIIRIGAGDRDHAKRIAVDEWYHCGRADLPVVIGKQKLHFFRTQHAAHGFAALQQAVNLRTRVV